MFTMVKEEKSESTKEEKPKLNLRKFRFETNTTSHASTSASASVDVDGKVSPVLVSRKMPVLAVMKKSADKNGEENETNSVRPSSSTYSASSKIDVNGDEREVMSPVLVSRKMTVTKKSDKNEAQSSTNSGQTKQPVHIKALLKTPEKLSLEDADEAENPIIRVRFTKRRRISSESETEEASTEPSASDDLDSKFRLLKQAFADKDDMELQDCLLCHDWSVEGATNALLDAEKPTTSQGKVFKLVADSKPGKKQSHKKTKIEVEEAEFDGDFNIERKVYFSDDSEEEYRGKSDTLVERDRRMVMDFLSTAEPEELLTIPGCTKKKADIIFNLRPFSSWDTLVRKVKNSKSISTVLLNGAREVLSMREVTEKLLKRCQSIGTRLARAVQDLTAGEKDVLQQPICIPATLKLAGYQLIGLHWLSLMHREELNGILGDEMGLGKTIQTLAFLAYLRDQGNTQPHLVVAPSSTIDNWLRELSIWCPFFSVLAYQGSQEDRKQIRIAYVNNTLEPFDIVVSSYSMVASSPEDRALFKRIPFKYVVFDEAHMLKNMKSLRYENLMKIKAERRLLLTGTPLQNNLIELMSLLVFVMPKLFEGKKELLKRVFALFPKTSEDDGRPRYEKDRIGQAKQILEPFFLRRLKENVLRDLPVKREQLLTVSMTPEQRKLYDNLVKKFVAGKSNLSSGTSDVKTEKGIAMVMQLRKMANHPLLMRNHYTESQLLKIARILKKDPSYAKDELKHVQEDLSYLSDFEIHKTCVQHMNLQEFALSLDVVAESGKCRMLDQLLPKAQEMGHRILLFSQFVIVLDVLEDYLKLRGYHYLRLDGQTPVNERQDLIDEYENNKDILVFMLSTRAGGLGINLTSANQVILHDIDYNPYNDKQAEDRCHRMGQTKEVQIIRLISEDSIEENIYSLAQEKLQLEANVTGRDKGDKETGAESKDVLSLLQHALKLKS